MEVQINVGEYASVNNDGTYTIVRGGLDTFYAEQGEAFSINGYVLVQIEAKPYESGDHELKVSAIDADGYPITDDELAIKFDVPNQGGKTKIPIGFSFTVEDDGDYEMGVTIDGTERATHSFSTEYHERS